MAPRATPSDSAARGVAGPVSVADDVLARAQEGGVAYDDLIEHPVVLERGQGSVDVLDRRVRIAGVDAWVWPLWGALMGMTAWLSWTSPWLLRGWTGLLVGAVVIGSGVLVWRRAREGRVPVWRMLARVDGTRGEVHVRPDPARSLDELAVTYTRDEVGEVIFASRRVPMLRGAHVDGAGVFLRFLDGSVWPVVPSTIAQGAAYRVAVVLSRALGVRVKQVGVGWLDEGAP